MGCSFGNCMWPNNYFNGLHGLWWQRENVHNSNAWWYPFLCVMRTCTRCKTCNSNICVALFCPDMETVIELFLRSVLRENWEFHKLVWSELSCISMDKHSVCWNLSLTIKMNNLLIDINLVSTLEYDQRVLQSPLKILPSTRYFSVWP